MFVEFTSLLLHVIMNIFTIFLAERQVLRFL